ncbi:hypothetical protein [Nocardia sp. CNY236]|uniref:Rv1733c family protein n=1 Tax=Nocardia sp. CNY236 TaxID=1169152 RepID=UPI0012DFD175|nr:hypothetical protein [Nocardia sp. CNY236]
MSHYPSLLVRVWRARPWSDNPLMRASDRWEAVVRLLAALAILITVPVAGAIGTVQYASTAQRIHSENSMKVSTEAVTSTAPQRVVSIGRYSAGSGRFEAEVQWRHDGREGRAVVEVPAATEFGSHITVWLDQDEAVTTPPRPPSVAAWSGILSGLTTLVGIACAVVAVVSAGDWLLDRMRGARWEAEWRQLGRPVGMD